MTSALRRVCRTLRAAKASRDAQRRDLFPVAAGHGYLITDLDALGDSGEPPTGNGYLFVPALPAR